HHGPKGGRREVFQAATVGPYRSPNPAEHNDFASDSHEPLRSTVLGKRRHCSASGHWAAEPLSPVAVGSSHNWPSRAYVRVAWSSLRWSVAVAESFDHRGQVGGVGDQVRVATGMQVQGRVWQKRGT